MAISKASKSTKTSKTTTSTTIKASSSVASKELPRIKATDVTGLMHLGITPYEQKPDEEYMNDKQKDHFRAILRNWRNMLMEQVDGTVGHLRDESPTMLADPNDQASLIEGLELELRTRDRERQLLKKIEKSLDCIDRDSYGFCDMCGIEIGIRRLEARPTANLCIDCKTIDEMKEAHHNR